MKVEHSENNRVQSAVYRPKIMTIQKVVAEYHGMTIKQVEAHSRKGIAPIVRRQVHYFCRAYVPNCPLHLVGLLTGNGKAWDHSTVIYNYRETIREMNFRNKSGELVYPEVLFQITEINAILKYTFSRRKKRILYHLRAMRHKALALRKILQP